MREIQNLLLIFGFIETKPLCSTTGRWRMYN